MAGKRNQRVPRLDALLGSAPTPEALAVDAQRKARAREALAQVRSALSPTQRRWMAAIELEVRCNPGESLDLARVAQNMGCDPKRAQEALVQLRRAFEQAGFHGFSIEIDPSP